MNGLVNLKLLKEKISNSGLKMTSLSKMTEIKRETLYNRLLGKGEFTASEIVSMTNALRLTKDEREKIFFD